MLPRGRVLPALHYIKGDILSRNLQQSEKYSANDCKTNMRSKTNARRKTDSVAQKIERIAGVEPERYEAVCLMNSAYARFAMLPDI